MILKGKMVWENNLSRFLLQTQFIMSKRNTKFRKLALLINSIDRPFEFYDLAKHTLFFAGTLRKTISYLCKAGYTERIERGRYKRAKTIPDDMNITELEKVAYKRE